VRVSDDSQSVTRWDLAAPHRGGFQSVGVGSGVTGHGADLAIIDDPVKGHEAADSETQREAVWGWYTHDLLTRLHPGASLVVCATRWHEDDLPGRILASADGGRWKVISMPALDDEGRALWPERYDADALSAIRESVGSRAWEALYQQRPTAEAGNLFRAEWFEETWDTLPKTVAAVITFIDPAMLGKQTSDEWAFTTGVVGRDGLLYLLNGLYGPMDLPTAEEHVTQIARRCAERWPDLYRVALEKSASGPALEQSLRRRASWIPVTLVDALRDKVARANAITPYCEARRVRFPRQWFPWCDSLRQQLFSFPLAAHDDRVDSFVGLVGEAVRRWAPERAASTTSYAMGGPSWAPLR
jgi:predicted phage terminase large subunit-like protein